MNGLNMPNDSDGYLNLEYEKAQRYSAEIKATTAASVVQTQELISRKGDGPALVFTGENHASANHVLAQIDLVLALKKAGVSVTLTNEIPDNYLETWMVARYGEPAVKAVNNWKERRRVDWFDKISAALAFDHATDASITRQLMSYVLGDQKIRCVMVDMPQRYGLLQFDIEKPHVVDDLREAAKILGYDPDSVLEDHPGVISLDFSEHTSNQELQISTVARNLYALRNLRALAAEEPETDVIIHMGGQVHLVGAQEIELPYRGSLADLCSREGITYTGIMYEPDSTMAVGASENPNLHHHNVSMGPKFSIAHPDEEYVQIMRELEAQHAAGISAFLSLCTYFGSKRDPEFFSKMLEGHEAFIDQIYAIAERAARAAQTMHDYQGPAEP